MKRFRRVVVVWCAVVTLSFSSAVEAQECDCRNAPEICIDGCNYDTGECNGYLDLSCAPTPIAEPTEDPSTSTSGGGEGAPVEEPPQPTEEPGPLPPETEIPEPTEPPQPEPTEELPPEPTAEPTAEPTVEPTTEPTAEPTAEPTTEPEPDPNPDPRPECLFSTGPIDISFDESGVPASALADLDSYFYHHSGLVYQMIVENTPEGWDSGPGSCGYDGYYITADVTPLTSIVVEPEQVEDCETVIAETMCSSSSGWSSEEGCLAAIPQTTGQMMQDYLNQVAALCPANGSQYPILAHGVDLPDTSCIESDGEWTATVSFDATTLCCNSPITSYRVRANGSVTVYSYNNNG